MYQQILHEVFRYRYPYLGYINGVFYVLQFIKLRIKLSKNGMYTN